ncbi:hypothetical protein KEM09_20730 [Carboxylicivirga mesophila]|uniref:TonB C-terminal domain-containing protein n=1 Tax=Carboxylicivirga mesophila TaxID=1166478 RepID=A0ABS5KFQ4_9BACT|nr:hypothetical protein [Carboxylicivirga mesophila]MBS2213846.1 hypothetical protein [Carboxylicivirga mesophila]
MKRLIKLLIFVLISANSFGTAQIPDLIIYNGDTLSLYSCPLDSFPNQDLINPQGLFGSKGCFYTACWRNYVATWEIINNELYLTEIKNACYPTNLRDVSASYKGKIEKDSIGSKYADLKKLFPQRFKNGKVKADWVNGKLYAPHGNLLYYVHDGFQSIYESELEVTIVEGAIIGSRILDNSKTKKSKYTEEPKLLKEYIYNNIRSENLPESDTIKRRVIIKIVSSDDNGKIDSVNILRGVNEIYDKEAVRVIKSIPEWEVIYRHGEKVNRGWMIPVNFDLTKKK